jgi:hypothetical protein
LRRQLGDAGRKEIETHLSETAYWDKYEKFMRTALASHPRKPGP